MRVLVVGPRKGLCEALAEERIPYVVWTDASRPLRSAERVHVAPIAVGKSAARREAETLAAHGPFTHVIAGTEAAVVPAAAARRVLGARLSAHTTVLRCHDKLRMKAHLRARGIPMAPFVSPPEGGDPAKIVDNLGLPIVLKPRALSGGREIEIVRDPAVLRTKRLRGRLLESWVDAPEVSVESFVNNGRILFENVTEYARKTHVNVVPAGLDDATRAAALELNRIVIRALRIQWGMTHLEMYLAAEGPLFGEIALRPPGGYIMDLLGLAWGFDSWRAFVAVEVDRAFAFPRAPKAHAAAVVLHPGPGTVAAIRGLADVRRRPEVVEARIRVRSGDRVKPRAGVSENVGHVVLCAPTREQLLEAWEDVDARLRVELA